VAKIQLGYTRKLKLAVSYLAQFQLHLSLRFSAANFVIGGSFLMVPTRGLKFLEELKLKLARSIVSNSISAGYMIVGANSLAHIWRNFRCILACEFQQLVLPSCNATTIWIALLDKIRTETRRFNCLFLYTSKE